jgi:hypothetical protein
VNWPAETDQHFAEAEQISGISVSQWKDVLTSPLEDQPGLFEDLIALGKMSWAAQSDKVARVISVLTVIGTIAGCVSGVGGAVSVIQALTKSL